MRTRNTLLAVQVGLSVTLLVVTALLTTSLLRALRADTGFAPERVLTVDMALPAARYAQQPALLAAYDRLLETVASVPGVQSVSTISLLPFGGGGQVNSSSRLAQPSVDRSRRGRSFAQGERDPNRLTPAVISNRAPTSGSSRPTTSRPSGSHCEGEDGAAPPNSPDRLRMSASSRLVDAP